MRTLILGIGNVLLSDEGAGVRTIEHLRTQHPLPGLVYLDGGTLSFSLAPDIEVADALIVVDAARMDVPAGTVREFLDAELDAHFRQARRSVHEVGLSDLLDMVRLTGALPTRRALIGIQPLELGWGERLSPRVSAAIPKAAAKVLARIRAWAIPHATHPDSLTIAAEGG